MDTDVPPSERTTAWLRKALAELPTDIRMIYIESGEHSTPTPENRTVARYDLFGFNSIPSGGFDPNNDDHVAGLGDWDWEANPNCEFPDVRFDSYVWLDMLESAVHDPIVTDLMRRREAILLFADHDGSISVVR